MGKQYFENHENWLNIFLQKKGNINLKICWKLLEILRKKIVKLNHKNWLKFLKKGKSKKKIQKKIEKNEKRNLMKNGIVPIIKKKLDCQVWDGKKSHLISWIASFILRFPDAFYFFIHHRWKKGTKTRQCPSVWKMDSIIITRFLWDNASMLWGTFGFHHGPPRWLSTKHRPPDWGRSVIRVIDN